MITGEIAMTDTCRYSRPQRKVLTKSIGLMFCLNSLNFLFFSLLKFLQLLNFFSAKRVAYVHTCGQGLFMNNFNWNPIVEGFVYFSGAHFVYGTVDAKCLFHSSYQPLQHGKCWLNSNYCHIIVIITAIYCLHSSILIVIYCGL